MANQIQITTRVNIALDGTTAVAGSGGNETTSPGTADTITLAGDSKSDIIQDVGTGSYEQCDTADVDTTASYYLFLKNLDSTNYVHVSYDAGTTSHDYLAPGKTWGPVRKQASKVVHLKADTATVQVQVLACEI